MSADDAQPKGKEWGYIRTVGTIALILLVLSILGGVILPGGGSLTMARKVQALNDAFQLCVAIKAYYMDYGHYPCERNQGDDSMDYFAYGGAKEAELFDVLGDRNPGSTAVKAYNPRHVIYLDVPMAKDLDHPANGMGRDGLWYDAYGNPFLVKMDSNYNGTLLNPYSANAGPAKVRTGVMVWSLGPDGKGATSATGGGDRNAGVYRDDIVFWKDESPKPPY